MVRVRVDKNRAEDIWRSFAPEQKVYNSFLNEWDVSELFGPVPEEHIYKFAHNSDSEDDDDPMSTDLRIPLLPAGTTANYEATHRLRDDDAFSVVSFTEKDAEDYANTREVVKSPIPFAVVDDLLEGRSTFTINFLDPLRVASDHYGFVPPLVRTAYPPIQTAEWNEHLKFMGFTNDWPSSDLYCAPLCSFISDLANKRRPLGEFWDLDQRNRQAVISHPNFPIVNQSPDSPPLYIFACQDSMVTWTLAVTKASDALLVCRRSSTPFFSLAACLHLVTHGIPFRTLLPMRSVPTPSSTTVDAIPIPKRFPGYEFNLADYSAYLDQRKVILSQPQGRAALLRGGILWRLAMEHLSIDAALEGPSSSVTVHRIGFKGIDEYWDDDLSKEDTHHIVGMYHFYTGLSYQSIKRFKF
jgi:hypothetical protein